MAETLLIKPSEMTAVTVLGGSIDPTRYTVNIAFAQVGVIEPLLGTDLYEKIVADFIADTLTGLYLELYTDYIKPILIHEATAEYIEVANFLAENGGVFMHTADNRATTTKDDTQFLAGKYHAHAQMIIKRFEKWICKNPLPEYSRSQDKVNAQHVKVTSGWYFGRDIPTIEEERNEISE